jgi:hypothetical protein
MELAKHNRIQQICVPGMRVLLETKQQINWLRLELNFRS